VAVWLLLNDKQTLFNTFLNDYPPSLKMLLRAKWKGGRWSRDRTKRKVPFVLTFAFGLCKCFSSPIWYGSGSTCIGHCSDTISAHIDMQIPNFEPIWNVLALKCRGFTNFCCSGKFWHKQCGRWKFHQFSIVWNGNVRKKYVFKLYNAWTLALTQRV